MLLLLSPGCNGRYSYGEPFHSKGYSNHTQPIQSTVLPVLVTQHQHIHGPLHYHNPQYIHQYSPQHQIIIIV